jgi:hypothetical protein
MVADEDAVRQTLSTTGALVSERFPLLFHYTDAGGVRGILEQNELWATHYRFLNDKTKVVQARQRILPIAVEVAKRKFAWWQADSEFRQHIEQFGGYESVVDHEVTSVINAVFQTTSRLAPQFIVSFSAHMEEEETTNGALDMWRAYPKDELGGYCLVINSHRFETLMAEEGRRHATYAMHLQDVNYLEQVDDDIAQVAGKIIDVLNGIYQTMGLQVLGDTASPGDVYQPVALEMTRHKNWHFRSEREIRLVTSPQTRRSSPGYRKITGREIFYRVATGCFVPTAKVFGKDVSAIPVEKIIVGPGDRQEQRAEGLRSFLAFLGADIEIVLSQVPFRSV